jgi:cell division FtsZ-interacting protein ZapD
MKPMATANAGSATMLMPTVKDLIDVNVKNNEQLIKMAAIAQRAVSSNSGNELIDMSEIEALLAEQKEVQEQGQKLLEQAPIVQINQ